MKKHIGDVIKELREKRNWSQRELATRVDMNYSVLNRIELGKRPAKDIEIAKFSEVFGVSTSYLLGTSETPTQRENNTNYTYDSLAEINKLVKKYGIEQMGFFDIEEWKNLGPEDIKMLDEQFKLIAKLAKERNKGKE